MFSCRSRMPTWRFWQIHSVATPRWPTGETIPGKNRILEAQQVLALVAGRTLAEIQQMLTNTYDGSRLIYRGDPLTTLYSLIIASQHLSPLIRSQLDPSDPQSIHS